MICSKDLPIDDKYPESCVYWIYHEDKHTNFLKEGYIGVSAYGASVRFSQHISDAKLRSNNPVHNAIRKYGDKMICKVIIKADPEFCLLLEEMLRPEPKIGYNICIGGQQGPLGMKHTPETRKKMSEDRKGEKAPMWGKRLSQSAKDKISKANTGREVTEANRLAASIMFSGEGNPFYGKTHTEATRLRLAELSTGKEISDETRKKMSDAVKGRKHSEESLRKMSKDGTLKSERPQKQKGWTKTDAQKKLVSENNKDRFRLPWNVPRCNHTVWSKAMEMFEYHLENPSHKTTALGKAFGLAQSAVGTILKKFQSGWNPNTDSEYVEWLNKLKGAENVA